MLTFLRVSHAYAGAEVLRDVSFQAPPGVVVALTGPSGCGKTTLLHLAAGLRAPDDGVVENRFTRIGYVFQDPRLLPWRTAAENITFGLKAHGIDARRQRQIADDLIEQLGLSGSAGKYPHQLSGGMRQRVALGRALAIEPDLLLMDEPFSALDIGLRRELQDLLLGLLARRRLAVLFVTHDLAEAIRIGDELVVLTPAPGRVALQQAGAPMADRLDDRFVYRSLAALLDAPAVASAFGLAAPERTDTRRLAFAAGWDRLKP